MTTTKFMVKAEEMKILGEMWSMIEQKEHDAHYRYGQTENMVQVKEWNRESREYEFMWEDEEHTIPKMKYAWGDILVSDEELSDEARTTIAACKSLKAKLEKLI